MIERKVSMVSKTKKRDQELLRKINGKKRDFRKLRKAEQVFYLILFALAIVAFFYFLFLQSCADLIWVNNAAKESSLVEINSPITRCMENGSSPFILVDLDENGHTGVRCIYNDNYTFDDYENACSSGAELTFYVLKSEYDKKVNSGDEYIVLRAVSVENENGIIASKEEIINEHRKDGILGVFLGVFIIFADIVVIIHNLRHL